MARRDPLTVEILNQLAEMTTRFYAEYEQVASAHQLTGGQARMLALVSDEAMPMSQLAGRMKCEPSNITGLVDRMEKRGLVTREPDGRDRRIKLVTPTETGREVSGQIWTALDYAANPLAGLNQGERETLRDLLRKIEI
jgi:DNA-binding MarR family transcriptional regulator